MSVSFTRLNFLSERLNVTSIWTSPHSAELEVLGSHDRHNRIIVLVQSASASEQPRHLSVAKQLIVMLELMSTSHVDIHGLYCVKNYLIYS